MNNGEQHKLNQTVRIQPKNVRPSTYGLESSKGPELSDWEPWMDKANCRNEDPDLFFPGQGGNTKTPKEVCGECAVRSACLEFAVDESQEFGIWGQSSEKQRREIRLEQSAPQKPSRLP